MDPTTVIEAIAASRDPKTTKSLFREARGEQGFSAAYFARIQAAFGSSQGLARRLSSHWRLMLEHGDEPALAYRAKGAFERLSGRWRESAMAFIRAGTLAPSERDRFSFQAGAIDALAHAGRVAEAIALGKKLARGLDKLNEPGLSGRVRLNLGHALLWVDRYAEARKWLQEAVAALRTAGYETESIYAQLSLSTAELFGGSPILAHRFAEEALAAAVAAGLDYTAWLCEINIAQAALMQGRADEALQVLLRVKPHLVDSPQDGARVSEFLGDAYLRLNLWPEAVDAYDEAIKNRRSLPALNLAASLLGRGQSLVAQGRAADALTPLRQAEKAFARTGNLAWVAACKTWISRALAAEGRVSAARKIAREAADQARKCRSHWHEAEALLTTMEHGLTHPPAVDLRRVSALIRAHGYNSLAWRVPALRSKFATPERCLAAHRRTFEAILSSRLLTSSSISRTAYLRDKGEHISAYLSELLSKPTKPRIAEAIEAVSRSRSATLIDEILSSAAEGLAEEQRVRLDQLRAELESLEVDGQLPNNARRMRANSERVAALQRRWIEATHQITAGALPSRVAETGVVVLVEARDGFYALERTGAKALSLSPDELEKRLKWIRFELLAPMADRDASPELVGDLIASLSGRIVAPWIRDRSRTVTICPDGQLWQVPWTTCVAVMHSDCEPVLALHPNLGAISETRIDRYSRAMLWVDRADSLYHAGEEERSFLIRFPNARVCRSACEVRESLDDEVELLHVICHARHNASNPMFSAMQFGDSSVYATEIARSRLRAGLVTLSACDTGNVSTAFRDEPDGLARSFLARGAKTVIGSLWPLDDEAAKLAYGVLFENVAQGAPLVQGLKMARASVRAWNEHPYFWGSLALFGGYGN